MGIVGIVRERTGIVRAREGDSERGERGVLEERGERW